MRPKAGIDKRPLFRLRIVHGHSARVLNEIGGIASGTGSPLQRESLRRGMVRSLLTEGGLFPLRPARRRPPHTTLAVHHVGVGVDLSVPARAVRPVTTGP